MTCASFRLLASSIVLLLACPVIASAQAPPPADAPAPAPPTETATPPATGATDPFRFIRFGAVVEGYYQYNWNRPHDRVNLLRAYDTRGNVFSIQQTALVVESEPDVSANRRFGARVDLQFGQATETVQGSPANEPRPEVYRNVWQAFGSYVFPVGRGLRMDFGKFASNLGFETNYAKDNHHFTRAYLFNFLPFYHGGLRLTLPVHDRVTVLYMLTNGIQQTEDFNNFKSSHITGIVKPVSTLTWTTNYFFGREQPDRALPNGPDGFFRVLDTQLAYAPTAPVRLGLDLTHVTNEVRRGEPALALDGLGAYARYQLSTPGALAVRYERLDDEGLLGGVEQVLHELTTTAEYRFDEGFLMRLEFRRDWSDRRFFTSRIPGDLRTQQTTLLLGGVWWFGNKTGAW